jgi:hypothetical protein
MGIASLFKQMSGKSALVIDSTLCINKEIYVQEIMLLPISVEKFLTTKLEEA